MRISLIVLLVLCVASVSLARRQHKKHHRRNWARVDDQVPQPPQPYYEPDVYYDPPISSDDNQNTNDGWENADDWANVEQRAPAAADSWSNVRQEAPVDDGWSNPAVDPVDQGFENPEVVNPAPVDQGFDNSEIVDPGFENPENVDSVPVGEAWGKEEEVNQNAWVEEREQPEVVEPEDPSEVDWQEAQQERKPWFDEQVEIRHEKPSPSMEEYDDGFEEEPVEAVDDIDMVGVDSFDDTNGDDITEEDLWENPVELDEGLDTSEELYGGDSESAEYSSETSENIDTSEELYGADSESQGYSSETSEEDIYGKRDGHDDWNGQEVDNDAEEDEEANVLWPSTTPADFGEPEAFEVLGQRWRAFTAWHYAVFAVAGAVFLVGFMIIVVTAIRACRYRKPMYRRLETEKLPVAV